MLTHLHILIISTIIPNISWFENSWWILLFSINDMLKPSIKVFILEKKPYRVFKMGLYLHVPMFWLKYYFLLKLLVYFQFIMTDNIHLKAWFLCRAKLKRVIFVTVWYSVHCSLILMNFTWIIVTEITYVFVFQWFACRRNFF